MITVEEIWAHLSPEDSDIENDYEFKMNIAFTIFQDNYVRKLFTTNEQIEQEKAETKKILGDMDQQSVYNQKYWLIEALARENACKSLYKVLHV